MAQHASRAPQDPERCRELVGRAQQQIQLRVDLYQELAEARCDGRSNRRDALK
jgi:hypothetical protein